MEELKACPFCGGKAEIVDHGGFFTVGCTNLDCAATIDLLEPSEESAAHDWNRRAAPENKPLTCEGCEELMVTPNPCFCCKRHWTDRYARNPEGEKKS